MKADPFYFEIKDMITQFIAAFDGVTIKRYNNKREVQDKLQVKYVYSPKQRVIHDITNKAKHITLPVIAVSMSSISRDPTRVFNKLDSSYHLNIDPTSPTGDVGREDSIPQPVPININVSMSILTKYQSDMDQILSNFIPFSNPYIVISWKVPVEFTALPREIRSEVLWNENINLSYPVELSPDTPYRVSADTSFTIKGWLFKTQTTPVKTIFEINTQTYAVSSIEDLPEMLSDTDNLNQFNKLLDY